jgi:hypothetical protein
MWLRLTKDTGETTVINMDNVTEFSRAPGDSVTKIRTITPKGDGLHIISVKEETDAILGMVQPHHRDMQSQ